MVIRRTEKWAREVLSLDYHISGIATVAETPYSAIYKIETNKGALFLKVNNEVFNYEPKITGYLHGKFPGRVLSVLFSNDELNAFIAPDSGPPFDAYFKAKADYAAIERALTGYVDIQQNVDVPFLRRAGIRDLSLGTLEDKFFAILCAGRNHLSKEKIANVLLCRDKIGAAICALVDLGIQDGLEHGDFHFGNMLFNNGEIVFIDWAEATVTNPLFSLCAFNNSLTRRLGIEKDSAFTRGLNRAYLDSFARFYGITPKAIDGAFALTEKLHSLYYLITLSDILAFDETVTKWHDRMNASLDKIWGDFG